MNEYGYRVLNTTKGFSCEDINQLFSAQMRFSLSFKKFTALIRILLGQQGFRLPVFIHSEPIAFEILHKIGAVCIDKMHTIPTTRHDTGVPLLLSVISQALPETRHPHRQSFSFILRESVSESIPDRMT